MYTQRLGGSGGAGCMVWKKVELNVTCVHMCVYVRCGSV